MLKDKLAGVYAILFRNASNGIMEHIKMTKSELKKFCRQFTFLFHLSFNQDTTIYSDHVKVPNHPQSNYYASTI